MAFWFWKQFRRCIFCWFTSAVKAPQNYCYKVRFDWKLCFVFLYFVFVSKPSAVFNISFSKQLQHTDTTFTRYPISITRQTPDREVKYRKQLVVVTTKCVFRKRDLCFFLIILPAVCSKTYISSHYLLSSNQNIELRNM